MLCANFKNNFFQQKQRKNKKKQNYFLFDFGSIALCVHTMETFDSKLWGWYLWLDFHFHWHFFFAHHSANKEEKWSKHHILKWKHFKWDTECSLMIKQTSTKSSIHFSIVSKQLHRDVKYSIRVWRNKIYEMEKKRKLEKKTKIHKQIDETIGTRHLKFGVLSKTFHWLCVPCALCATFAHQFVSFHFHLRGCTSTRLMSRPNDIGSALHTVAPNWNWSCRISFRTMKTWYEKEWRLLKIKACKKWNQTHAVELKRIDFMVLK